MTLYLICTSPSQWPITICYPGIVNKTSWALGLLSPVSSSLQTKTEHFFDALSRLSGQWRTVSRWGILKSRIPLQKINISFTILLSFLAFCWPQLIDYLSKKTQTQYWVFFLFEQATQDSFIRLSLPCIDARD